MPTYQNVTSNWQFTKNHFALLFYCNWPAATKLSCWLHVSHIVGWSGKVPRLWIDLPKEVRPAGKNNNINNNKYNKVHFVIHYSLRTLATIKEHFKILIEKIACLKLLPLSQLRATVCCLSKPCITRPDASSQSPFSLPILLIPPSPLPHHLSCLTAWDS